MARVKWADAVSSIRGKMGKIVYKKRGKTFYTSSLPNFRRRKLSPSQKASINRFRSAVIYARGVLADPVARMPFEREAKKKKRTVYNFIIADYLSR